MIVTDFLMHGIPVYVDDNMCQYRKLVQYKFPKSKKKRIRRKWSLRSKNWRCELRESILKFEDKIIISTKAFEILKHSL